MQWEILDKPGLTAFLDAVKTSSEAPLFSSTASDARYTALPFYKNVSLYRLTNFISMPVFSLHFLYDGARYFYLDGTEAPLVTIADMHGLNLTAHNIVTYLNFYFFAVVREEGEMFLVQDPKTYPFQDMSAYAFEPAYTIGKNAPKYDITAQEDGSFLVRTPMFMDGAMIDATLRAEPNGRVHILSQKLMTSAMGNK